MPDPILECVAELIFADQLIDIHEVEVLIRHPWFSSYCTATGLTAEQVKHRLMVAHDDPVPDTAALRQLRMEDRRALLELMGDIAAVDLHPDPRELAVLKQTAEKLQLENIQPEALIFGGNRRTQGLQQELRQPTPPPRKRIRLIRRIDRMLGQETVDRWGQRTRQIQRINRWRRMGLFNHRDYRGSLSRMQVVSGELLPQTLDCLQWSSKAMSQLRTSFQKVVETPLPSDLPQEQRQQLRDMLETSRQRLDRLIEEDLVRLDHDLQAKKRSLGTFCIALMGRTKAGKSTMLTTLTGQDQGAIGDGRQGFTRFNRAYDFYGMRLIDTPGIGAAGGQGETAEQAEARDSSVARSIFPETDLVCFVMDNDSIVPSMRSMMSELHERGKAFIILLNVKASTQGGLKLFQQRLEALFADDGDRSIQGNIAAIRRDLSKCVGIEESQRIPIIPVHARAALKAREIEDPIEAEQWRQYSRIDHFLEALDELITARAEELRRQTLRKNTRLEINGITRELNELQREMLQQAEVFGSAKQAMITKVSTLINDTKNSSNNQVQELFQNLELKASIFSQQHFKKNEQQINELWKKALESEDLNSKLEKIIEHIRDQLKDGLSNIQSDIEGQLKFQMQTINLKSKVGFDYDLGFEEGMRQFLKIGGRVLVAIGAFLLGPAGWVGALFGGVGSMVYGWITDFFMSKEAKERREQEVQQKLRDRLLEDIHKQRDETLKQLLQGLDQQRQQIIQAVTHSLGTVEQSIQGFSRQLQLCSKELESQASLLN